METCKVLKIFMHFYLKKLILLKIKASLMELWKSLIILKEIKKPNGKFLRVLAINQLRFEIVENILKFTYKIPVENGFFTHFLSRIQGT